MRIETVITSLLKSEFHSRRQADEAFTSRLIDAMMNDGFIEAAEYAWRVYHKKSKK